MATLQPQRTSVVNSDKPKGNFVPAPVLARPYAWSDKDAVREAIANMRRPLPAKGA